ncbi:hypothetical protein E2562_018992 [Oryza meyeriana var. granulata]|uniref:Uncharacterized protein n=1 Tax=Oryza meyeriana var. granulata TaxID=110450 RepID=A0A6G1DJY5_9ORYZ|nr:hypothetical protein E2562_018992 [Oryza meyeriana var. granulata]
MWAHGRGDAGGTTTLVVFGKSPEDQQLLASATGSLALGEHDSVEDIAISLDADAGASATFNAGAYMATPRASRFGRKKVEDPEVMSPIASPVKRKERSLSSLTVPAPQAKSKVDTEYATFYLEGQ